MKKPTALELHRALQRLFGFPGFRPGQAEVVERVLAGEHVLAVMPTGAGKSLCYQLPAALLPGPTLVISPLIALMKDQVDGLPPSLARVATVINSAVARSEVERRLRAIADGKLRLVYAAPERLRQLPFLYYLAKARPSLFVVDEAHCVDLWGHDFRPDYTALHAAIRQLGSPTVLALTATATPRTAATIGRALGVPLTRCVYGITRPNLRLEIERYDEEDARREAVVARCHAEAGRGLIYMSTRRGTERMAALLRRRGVEAAYYHAGLSTQEREGIHARYQSGALRVLVATVAFGLGIDISDIRFLLHYAPPTSLEAYAQEAGRAGRDGLPARCTLYITPSDTIQLHTRAVRDAPTLERLEQIYAAVRQMVMNEPGLVAMDDLRRETGLEATPIRVGMAYLEGAKLLRRHYDAPISISVRRANRTDSPAGPPQLLRLLETACPKDGSWNDMTAPLMSEELGLSVDALEPFLLACQEEGWIQYRSGAREFTLECPTPPDGARSTLEKAIHRYREAQAQRIQSLLDYVNTTDCRHHHLAAYFAHDAPATCAACDICRPSLKREEEKRRRGEEDIFESRGDPQRLTPDADDIVRILLRCVASLPYALGRNGVVQLLRGATDSPLPAARSSYHGALRKVEMDELNRVLDDLLAKGLLRYRYEGTYRLLALTPAGARVARSDTEEMGE